MRTKTKLKLTNRLTLVVAAAVADLLWVPMTVRAQALSGSTLTVTGSTTLQGNVSVTGTSSVLDFYGRSLYMGSVISGSTLQPGISAIYTDGTSSKFSLIPTRQSHQWTWEYPVSSGSSTPLMTLDPTNGLKVYDTSGNSLVLSPASIGVTGAATILTQQAADNKYVSSSSIVVGTGPSVALVGGTATAACSFAGINAAASDYGSVAIGCESTASGYGSTASGCRSTASGGASTASGYRSTASGLASSASGFTSSASGDFSTASGVWATASGGFSTASGAYSKANDWNTTASGYRSTANAGNSIASGNWSTANGGASTASGYQSTTSGGFSTASGWGANANGWASIASGNWSTATGYQSTASGYKSFTRGDFSIASGFYSNASGRGSAASGWGSTASGFYSTASGIYSGASGWGSTASGFYSSASGFGAMSAGCRTTAQGFCQTVVGVNNIPQGATGTWSPTDPLFIIGNGTVSQSLWGNPLYDQNGNQLPDVQSNALVMNNNGDTTLYGKLTVSGTGTGLIVTGTAVPVTLTSGTTTTKIISSGTTASVLIPEQGDLSMGDFVNGAKPSP